MKVRVGYGLGARSTTNDQEGFTTLVDDLERLGFDSLWVSERVSGEAPDPIVAMAFAAARTQRLKFGMSVMVLPGRNPVLTAKALASLDRMSNGRLLPAFGLGVADPREQRPSGSSAPSGPLSSTRPCRSCAGCGKRTTSTTTAPAGTSTA